MKKWEYNYSGSVIAVENRMSGERLYVNGELQDETMASFTGEARLWGRLPAGEEIKVSLGGAFSVQCRVFVDNKLLMPK